MQVAQRGTSTASITTDGYYTADRWQVSNTTLGTWTQSVENDAPTGSGFQKSLKMLCTTADSSPAAGDYLAVRQQLEGQDVQRIAKGTASAQQLTVSFWIKSNVTGTYDVLLVGSSNARLCAATYTVSASATWEKKAITFRADTTGPFANDNAVALQVQCGLGAGSTYTSGTLQTTWAANNNANRLVGQVNLAAATNNYWQITGVQLEVGPIASPFDFKPFGQELAECQRYYFLAVSGSGRNFGTGFYYSATQSHACLYPPVTMRTTPVLSVTTGTDYYNFQRNSGSDFVNSFIINTVCSTFADIYNTTESSGTAGQAGVWGTNNASASIGLSAEL